MHFWYVGILMEFYILIPLVLLFIKSVSRILHLNFEKLSVCSLSLIALISFVFYLNSNISQFSKFYFLPYRLYELIIGGLVGFGVNNHRIRVNSVLGYFYLIGIISVLCGTYYLPRHIEQINPVSGQSDVTLLVPQSVLLVVSVVLTGLFLMSNVQFRERSRSLVLLAQFGKMSFSVFVWHQVLLAFYRYYFGVEMTARFVCLFLVVTIILSLATFYGIEQRVKFSRTNFVLCIFVMLFTFVLSGFVYLNAGVVRDVPELDIKKGESVKRGMFANYCDRVYKLDKDFVENSNKINVLVEGMSFGRDFVNILLESDWSDSVNISYISLHDEKYLDRYAECDYCFTFSSKDQVPKYVWSNVKDDCKIYGLGPKNFGECNGNIYIKKNKSDSFLTTKINSNFYVVNEAWKKEWGKDMYIDFIELGTMENGEICVFTDDGKFISHDCRHLTKFGAKYFAKLIEWNRIFRDKSVK